jgi:hypothetical protein
MKMLKLSMINGVKYFGKTVKITTITTYNIISPLTANATLISLKYINERFQRFVIYVGLNEQRDRADVISYNGDAIFDPATQLGVLSRAEGIVLLCR